MRGEIEEQRERGERGRGLTERSQGSNQMVHKEIPEFASLFVSMREKREEERERRGTTERKHRNSRKKKQGAELERKSRVGRRRDHMKKKPHSIST